MERCPFSPGQLRQDAAGRDPAAGISVTTTPSAWSGTEVLTEDAPRIRTALGLHPQMAHELKDELRAVGRVGSTKALLVLTMRVACLGVPVTERSAQPRTAWLLSAGYIGRYTSSA